MQTEPLSQELAAEFELVRRWGVRVPALTYCLLPSETTWVRRRGRNVWIPVASDNSEAGRAIRQDWLFAALLDSPSLIQEYGFRDTQEEAAYKAQVRKNSDSPVRIRP